MRFAFTVAEGTDWPNQLKNWFHVTLKKKKTGSHSETQADLEFVVIPLLQHYKC